MSQLPIFIDSNQDKHFKEKGYIIVDLLDSKIAKKIFAKVKILKSGVDATFYTSLWSSDSSYREAVNTIIFEEIASRAQPLLHDYKPLFGDLLVKRPSLTKDFPIHQDWTFVDEEIYTSLYVWCPLVDVGYWNGNLQVVEGSHQILDKIRGANIKVSYEAIKPQIQKNFLKDIPLKAGQAIIFNQALLHASPPNRSLSTRIAMGLLLIPAEAQIYHYMMDANNNCIRRYKVDVDFFMNYSKNIDFKNALESSTFAITNSYPFDEVEIKNLKNINFKQFNHKLTSILVS